MLVWVENVKNSHRVAKSGFSDNKAVKRRPGESKITPYEGRTSQAEVTTKIKALKECNWHV